MITKHKKELSELQATRKAAEALAREEAELLLRQSVMRHETLSDDRPLEVNGFVFSPSDLIATINRRAAVASARFYEKNGWNPNIPYREDQKLSIISVKPLPKAA